ncbi:hypothetical protein F5Y17DRAFT_463071 [Xylariaceae sp. FL0594]|nr:hypothetical protein F5Y17DRAFT_463071 [Xylariaceae sp. FL0594]
MASGEFSHQHTRDPAGINSDPPTTLLDLLSNTLVLYQTIPYLPVSSILKLAVTSRSFHHLLYSTPGVFRHLDLTQVKSAQLGNGGVGYDGQASGPLRDIFSRLAKDNLLQDVNTLVLDGLSVTAEFITELLVSPTSRVRTLSIREVKNLDERKLMQALRHACRPTRPEWMPRLKALYYFGNKDAPAPPSPASCAQSRATSPKGANIALGWNHKSQHALNKAVVHEDDDWYSCKGRVVNRRIAEGWADTMAECRGIIRFDTVLCTGPRHPNSAAFGKAHVMPAGSEEESRWGVATFALNGCASCGTAPEGFTVYADATAEKLPLLSPVPLHSSTIKAATCPKGARQTGNSRPQLIPRCLGCIRERYCFSCNQWWCEDCYQVPSPEELSGSPSPVQIVDETSDVSDQEGAALEKTKVKRDPKITRSCWECERNCLDCIAETQKRCKSCGGGYCIIHHEGSTATLKD